MGFRSKCSDREPLRPLEPRCRLIAVERDDQSIAGRLGLSEQRHMPRMQQVKTTVGKANLESMAPPARDQIQRVRTGHDLVGGMRTSAVERGDQLASIGDRGSDLADDNPGGGVGETRSISLADACGKRRRNCCIDGIGGARHVVYLAHGCAFDARRPVDQH
jgi:hypothetical protein